MTTFPQLLSRIFNVLFFEPNNIFNNIVHLKSAQTCCFDDRVITCAASHRMARTAHVQHDIPQSMNHAEWTRTVQSCARNFSSTLPAHCRLSLRCLPMGGGGYACWGRNGIMHFELLRITTHIRSCLNRNSGSSGIGTAFETSEHRPAVTNP